MSLKHTPAQSVEPPEKPVLAREREARFKEMLFNKYYNNFFTEEWMIDWVKERYQDDFKIFNYDMDLPR